MSTLQVDTITDEAGTGPVEFSNGINVSGGTVTGIDLLKYTTVSGATQALDVGSHNFFDAGTLTADTTVSFSNVPTEARWTYVAEVGGTTAWDISAAPYVRNFSVATQDTYPQGIFFKPDGTVMYVSGSGNDAVNEYSLSTAWNVSTASYVQNFSVATQDTLPTGLFFKPDGTVMYVVGNTGDAVYEYSLSTAWDVSTASYVQNFSVATQDTYPQGIFFKPDGTVMYVSGSGNDAVYEYSLSTAWDISTASYVQNFSIAAQEASPTGLFFKPDGTVMYVVGSYNDAVNEYSTAAPTSITVPASVQNPPSEVVYSGAKASYTFFTADGGTNVYLINEEVL